METTNMARGRTFNMRLTDEEWTMFERAAADLMLPVSSMIRMLVKRSTTPKHAVAVENFMATIGSLTLDEALANVEMDARSYGWPRETVRELASKVRLHFARKPKVVI